MMSLILFLIPLISGIFLAIHSQWSVILIGLAIIVLTPIIMSALLPIEKRVFKKISAKNLSWISPIYYFVLVIVSITICWFLVNSKGIGNIWFFLYAFSCCFLPYNHMMQGEEEITGKPSLITRGINNFSVLGYLIFGILMNFTSIYIIWAYSALIGFGIFMLVGLPARLRDEMNV